MIFFKKSTFLPFKRVMVLTLWGLFLGISLSCQKKDPSGPYTYLIPWPNGAGEYKLQEVTLKTLKSPYVMEGAAARVYSDQGFLNSSLAGRPARPNLSLVKGVYIPQDIDSALAVAVYAHFENLKLMEEQYQLPTKISWPRVVGIGVPVRLSNGSREENNARYFMREDIVGITPYSGPGLHLALNAGVLAHEHFHAVFERLFMPQVYLALKQRELRDFANFKSTMEGEVPVEKLSEDEASDVFYQNQLVLRAWNEGLADFFAFVYTSDPDFMNDSMAPQVREARRLDGPVGTLKSSSQLLGDMKSWGEQGDCPRGFCMAYTEGTKVARLLFDVWRAAPQDSRWEILREVLRGIESASFELSSKMANEALSLKSLLPYIVSAERIQKSGACKAAVLTFGGEITAMGESLAEVCFKGDRP